MDERGLLTTASQQRGALHHGIVEDERCTHMHKYA
jgi:hypothetical protein